MGSDWLYRFLVRECPPLQAKFRDRWELCVLCIQCLRTHVDVLLLLLLLLRTQVEVTNLEPVIADNDVVVGRAVDGVDEVQASRTAGLGAD